MWYLWLDAFCSVGIIFYTKHIIFNLFLTLGERANLGSSDINFETRRKCEEDLHLHVLFCWRRKLLECVFFLPKVKSLKTNISFFSFCKFKNVKAFDILRIFLFHRVNSIVWKSESIPLSEHDGGIPLTGKPNPTPDFIAQKLEVKSFINLLSSMRIFHRTFSFCPSTRPRQKFKQLQIHCNVHKARGAYLGHTEPHL